MSVYRSSSKPKRKKLEKDFGVEQNVIKNNALDKLKELLVGKITTGVLLSEDGFRQVAQQRSNDQRPADLESIPFELLSYVPLDSELEFQVQRIVDGARNQLDAV